MHRGPSRARRLLALLVVPIVATLSACGSSSSTTNSTGSAQIAVGYTPITTALPAWVAQEQGFFKQNNLDVALKLSANINTMPPLMGKEYDLALSTQPDLVKAASNGLDIVQVSGDALDTKANPTVLIMVRPDSGIKSISDLKGKRIAAPSLGGNIHLSFLHLLEQNGVPAKSVQAVQVPSPNIPDQLTAKQVDAAEILQPFANELLSKGMVSLGNPFRSIGDSVTQTFWIADRSWAESHRDTVVRWVKSLQQANDFIKSNKERTVAIMEKYTKQPAETLTNTPLPDYSFSNDVAQLSTWIDIMRQVGDFKPRVDDPKKLVLSP
ncbi:MAG: ABC transporter substrate-binding protein [Pseudonocardia sp.]|nr:ABC transporter substrate-binding protein [Pseudonocardia sp.]